MDHTYIGIDLGGTNVKAALVSSDGKVRGKAACPTPAEDGPDAVMSAMVRAAEGAALKAHTELSDVTAVGIGAPGPMNWRTGVVYSPPNLSGWKDVPLAEAMSDRLQLPCYVENDANAATYGEFWSGAGRGANTLCLLTLGTGVGGGIIIDEKLHRGIDGTAGEIGHLAVTRKGRVCGCGATGCLEAYGSVTGMVRTAREGIEGGEETSLSKVPEISGRAISEEAKRGDAFCQSVIRETGEWIGVGIADLINLFNPEKVVLCGGMIGAGAPLMEAITNIARERAFDVPARRAEIVFGALGSDAGVIGAAGCAMERHTKGAS